MESDLKYNISVGKLKDTDYDCDDNSVNFYFEGTT